MSPLFIGLKDVGLKDVSLKDVMVPVIWHKELGILLKSYLVPSTAIVENRLGQRILTHSAGQLFYWFGFSSFVRFKSPTDLVVWFNSN